jgi:phosphoglycolate phosphatase
MRVIIFDYDGVFVDSLAYCAGVHNRLCADHNLPPVDGPAEMAQRFMNDLAATFHADGMDQAALLSYLKAIQAEFAHSYHDLPPVEGMRELVMSLNDERYIVTSNVSIIVERHMREHGIGSMIEVLGADKEFSKIKKIETIKAKHPGDKVIFVTDTVNDIIEGKHTGAIIIAVTWGYHDRQTLEKAGPDHVVDTPAELKILLEKL